MIRKIQANVPILNWLLESINKKQHQLLCLCVDKTHAALSYFNNPTKAMLSSAPPHNVKSLPSHNQE